ncbi:hypothetical protein AcW1_003364 [Taiwanofungus camphoratus]|nr:hypothetical protein AcW1_003364 [Antrodia cinnamomea]
MEKVQALSILITLAQCSIVSKTYVSKVLVQACCIFRILKLSYRAYLVLIVEVEDDEEIEEHRFLCTSDDAMARAGAEPNHKFTVQIDEEDR